MTQPYSRNYLRDVEMVSSLWDVIRVQIKFVWDVSTYQGCGMTGGVALLWDVWCVQREVPEGCHERLQVGR